MDVWKIIKNALLVWAYVRCIKPALLVIRLKIVG